MKRRVTCEVSDHFDVCWMSLHVGRTMLINDAQGKQTRDERRRDRDILRLFLAVSDEAPNAEPLQTGDKQRTFHKGETITFQQIELDRLMAMIDRVPWATGKLEAVEDTLDWLSAAEKVEA